jgi:hypothetical protein
MAAVEREEPRWGSLGFVEAGDAVDDFGRLLPSFDPLSGSFDLEDLRDEGKRQGQRDGSGDPSSPRAIPDSDAPPSGLQSDPVHQASPILTPKSEKKISVQSRLVFRRT